MNFHPEYKDKTKKSKKKKHKTECSVLQRHGCGICGSENVAIQGVKFCEICGAEIEFLNTDDWFFRSGVIVPCDCVETTIIKNRKHQYRKVNSIGIKKCLDCGAICSNYCPNCKQQSLGYSYYGQGCWKKGDKRYCKTCGFRT